MIGWRKSFVFRIIGIYLYIEWVEKDLEVQEMIFVL